MFSPRGDQGLFETFLITKTMTTKTPTTKTISKNMTTTETTTTYFKHFWFFSFSTFVWGFPERKFTIFYFDFNVIYVIYRVFDRFFFFIIMFTVTSSWCEICTAGTRSVRRPPWPKILLSFYFRPSEAPSFLDRARHKYLSHILIGKIQTVDPVFKKVKIDITCRRLWRRISDRPMTIVHLSTR